MASGANVLRYQAYLDVARSSRWCNNQTLSDTIPFVNMTATRTYPMYGRVASGQRPADGIYSDGFLARVIWGGGTVTSATSTVNVTSGANVTCSVAATSLAFGTYHPSAAATCTATVAANCTSGAPFTISMNGGLSPSGTSRKMAGSNGGPLTYELFSDPSRTVP